MSIIKNITPTVDIIDSLVAEFNALAIGDITGIATLSVDNYRISTCYTGWARVSSVIIINSVNYTVTAFVTGVSLDVTGTTDPTGETTFQQPGVKYFHDTMFGQNDTITKTDFADKYPMMWLHEVFRDVFVNDPESSIDRTSNLRMFVLDNSNYEDWNNDSHYQFIIQPMLNLVAAFDDFLRNHKDIGDYDQHTVISHKNFGKFVEDGHVQQVLNDHTSGVEYLVDIAILKDLACADC